jgi:sialidase-1
MIGWWKLDNDAKDSSGSEYHGIIKGDPKWVDTQIGGALELDGNDDYIQTPDDRDKLQLTGDYTFSLWIKADAIQNGWVGIFSKCNASGSMNHWTLQFDGSSPRHLIIHHPDNLPMPRFWDTGIRLTDIIDSSHHISIVRSGETMTSYLDGSPRKTGTWHNDPGSGNGHLNIGVSRTANPRSAYKGLLDDIRIYNYVLTEAEIKGLYEGGEPTTEKN